MQAEVARAKQLLDGASRVAVVAHERPDGDAVGSMLALCLSLRELGKQAHSVLAGGLPGRYAFMPGSAEVQRRIPEGVALVITVDAADLGRLGLSDVREVHINFDHHPSNTRFAAVNLVDPAAAATTALLYRLAPELGLPITPAVAENLLAGLVTDTIGFRTPNVTPETLRLAAELIEAGANLEHVYRKGLVDRTYLAVRYWGQGLSKLERQGDLIWTSLSLADRKSVGYPGPDDADLIEILSAIQEARVAVVFVEQSERQVKVSWRARPGIDVAAVANQFNGGGHTLAAGAVVEGGLKEVMDRVLAATAAAIHPVSGSGA
ncbi:MAG: bifunctional oligoribonuclease/PAP phosphatase NrnA [Chloroflexota bacterium]